MAYLVTFHWGWLLTSLLLGFAMGWIAVVHRGPGVSKVTSRWLAVLVAALGAARLGARAQRTGGLIFCSLRTRGIDDSSGPLPDVRSLQRLGQQPALRRRGAALERTISRRPRRLLQIGAWQPRSEE